VVEVTEMDVANVVVIEEVSQSSLVELEKEVAVLSDLESSEVGVEKEAAVVDDSQSSDMEAVKVVEDDSQSSKVEVAKVVAGAASTAPRAKVATRTNTLEETIFKKK
jgi:hypothetical protein